MTPKDKEFLKKLLATFTVEAQEHINAISSGLIALERASLPEEQMEIIEGVFREAHSLKGAARAVNFIKVESICQSLESLFAGLKAQQISLSQELFDQLYKMVDSLGELLSSDKIEPARVNTPQPAQTQTASPADAALGQKPFKSDSSLAPQIFQPAESATSPRQMGERRRLSETLRVSTSKLDSLLRQAEELIPIKATAAQRVIETREIRQGLTLWEKEWGSVRPLARALQRSLRGEQQLNPQSRSFNGQDTGPKATKILAFLEHNENILHSVKNQLAVLSKHLESDCRVLDRRVDELAEDMKQISMVPFSILLESFPRLVRDLCRDCGKEAELTIVGGEIEADRRILEEMKDPLIHLVRNCIDHGIEPPKQREEQRKPLRAAISIVISHKSADKVEITISDDGAGIDIEKVRTAAVKFGRISHDNGLKDDGQEHDVQKKDVTQMDEQQMLSFIFESGVSTSPMITEVSGRGLGLAIVREKIQRVGGSVSVETRLGIGTIFRLILPLTLARFRGILVRVGESHFVLPTMHVRRVIRISPEEIHRAENRETIQIDGRPASSVWLGDVLEIARRSAVPGPKLKLPVLVLAWASEQIGFFVDEILGEQEVLVKGLGKQLPRVRNIAGAAVLGTGKVLPVLNVADLMRSAVNIAPVAARPIDEAPKSVLVAEDSITARTLLKNILESAGYRVKTAVDGAEALTFLASQSFDLVMSDVDMPRMNGFDLTTKIRADKSLSRLPVVLVTALASREDRERGADVGANAYIVKSSFDQGTLLEVIRRLI
jgi:two-component system chemotaxis sensor kinase CheA